MSGIEHAHSCESSQWFTPPELIACVHDALGGRPDLDPASCEAAAPGVDAVVFHDESADGLAHPWAGSFFCNPPNPPRPWWEKAVREFETGLASRGVFLAYSIQLLQQAQRWDARSVLDFPICIPDRRIQFLQTAQDAIAIVDKKLADKPDRSDAPALRRRRDELAELPPLHLVKGPQPPGASALVGLGIERGRFRRAFSTWGGVL